MKTKRNMKTVTKKSLQLPLTALMITTAIAGSVWAEPRVPFNGTVEGAETVTFDGSGPRLAFAGAGTGIATSLGLLDANWNHILEADPSTANGWAEYATGTRTFTDIRGDVLYAVSVAQGSDPVGDDNYQEVVEWNTITGGTGRFVGASGSFTLEREVTNFTDTWGTFQGTIVLKGAPLNGEIDGTEDVQFDPAGPKLIFSGIGTGSDSSLGNVDATWDFVLDADPSRANGWAKYAVGSRTFIDGNGDELYTHSIAQGTDPDKHERQRVVETNIITGGTGRFEGARGGFILERKVSGFVDTWGSFQGRIILE